LIATLLAAPTTHAPVSGPAAAGDPTLAQVVLLAALVVIAWVYLTRLRSSRLDRALAMAGALGLGVLIANPAWSNVVAGWFGIGRGVDFVIYVAIAGLAFLNVTARLETRRLSRELADIVRELAIQRAEPPSTDSDTPR
jgi:hypothetical protein